MADSINPVAQNIFQDTQPQSKAATKDLGRNEFLNLLTMQLKSQDPLKPADNQQFAAQLAQFSQLEQLTDIKASLDNQIQSNLLLTQSITNISASSLIGKSVKATSGTIDFDGSNEVKIGYNLPSDAASVKIDIRDKSGAIVRTIEPSGHKKGDTNLTWDGKNNQDITLASGTYTMTVTALDKNGSKLAAAPFTFGKVSAVRFKPEGSVLVVNGREIALGDITDISE